MDKLFRWTIYLMIIFVIAVAIYIYMVNFKPVEKKEVMVEFRTIHVSKILVVLRISFHFVYPHRHFIYLRKNFIQVGSL